MGNDSELNIVIKAKNAASKVLKDVGDQSKGLGKHLKSAYTSAVGPSKVLAAGIAAGGVALAGFGVLSVKSFMEAEAAGAQLNAVIKSTGGAAGVTADELMKQATALQGVTKFSDEAVMATQSMLLTFTQIKGGVLKDATKTALDMAQALGMDGKQAAMQLGKALNDPITGLSKLQRVGVTFNEQQKKQITAMAEAGDVAGAQKLMLEELRKEFGGSAEAAGQTFAGQLEILKNTFGDLMEGVGGFIVGALRPLVGALAGVVGKIAAAGGFLEIFKKLWNDNKDTVIIVAGALMGALLPAFISITAAGFGAAASMLAFFAPLLPWIALGMGLALVVKTIADRLGGWGNLWNAVKAQVSAFLPVLKSVADGFMKGLGAAINFIVPILKTAGNFVATMLVPSLKALWNAVGPQLTTVFRSLVDVAKSFWGVIQALWPVLKIVGIVIGAVVVAAVWLFINALKAVLPVVNFVVQAIRVAFNVIGFIIRLFVSIFKIAFNVVKTVVVVVFNVIKAIIGGVFTAIRGMINGYIAFWRGAFNVARAVVSGVVSAIGSYFRGAFNLVRSIWSGVTGVFRGVVSGIGRVVRGVTSAISAPFRAAFDGIKSLWNNTIGKLSFKIPDWVPGIGGNSFSMPKLAQGTTNFAGGLAMVGERGREVVALPRGSRVYSNQKTEAMLANSKPPVQFNLYNPVFKTGEAVQEFFRQADQDIMLAMRGVAPMGGRG